MVRKLRPACLECKGR